MWCHGGDDSPTVPVQTVVASAPLNTVRSLHQHTKQIGPTKSTGGWRPERVAWTPRAIAVTIHTPLRGLDHRSLGPTPG